MNIPPATGKLYLVATPIGNLDDITLRALEVLRQADVIAAEDTRRTRKLLSHFDIHSRLISYHAHNEHAKTASLLEQVRNGTRLAVVSDAGTPGIADPGFLLTREAVRNGIEPEIIPGVSALTFAAAAAALPVDRFAFHGFPPVKPGKRRSFFQRIAEEDKTVFIFESPFRIERMLDDIATILGADTRVAIIREATKLHEEILRGTAKELIQQTAGRKWQGECVIAIHAANADAMKASAL